MGPMTWENKDLFRLGAYSRSHAHTFTQKPTRQNTPWLAFTSYPTKDENNAHIPKTFFIDSHSVSTLLNFIIEDIKTDVLI